MKLKRFLVYGEVSDGSGVLSPRDQAPTIQHVIKATSVEAAAARFQRAHPKRNGIGTVTIVESQDGQSFRTVFCGDISDLKLGAAG